MHKTHLKLFLLSILRVLALLMISFLTTQRLTDTVTDRPFDDIIEKSQTGSEKDDRPRAKSEG